METVASHTFLTKLLRIKWHILLFHTQLKVTWTACSFLFSMELIIYRESDSMNHEGSVKTGAFSVVVLMLQSLLPEAVLTP